MIDLSTTDIVYVHIGSNQYDEVYVGDNKVFPSSGPTPPPHDYSQDYFTIKPQRTGTLTWSGSSTANTLSYSTDGGETWSQAAQTQSLNVSSGDTVIWKGTCTPSSGVGIGAFDSSTNCYYSVEGNPMSLLHGDNFSGQTSLNGYNYAFCRLFCLREALGSKVVSAENLWLSFDVLSEHCYDAMFRDNSWLTTPPSLDSPTLASYCYYNMFSYCGLTTIPVLSATTLATYCYYNMFYRCVSITGSVTIYPSSKPIGQEFRAMFRDCTGITSANVLLETIGYTALVELFSGCTSLSYIKAMFTTKPSSAYTQDWVKGVAASGTFVMNSAATWNPEDVRGVNGIPQGWTVQYANN